MNFLQNPEKPLYVAQKKDTIMNNKKGSGKYSKIELISASRTGVRVKLVFNTTKQTDSPLTMYAKGAVPTGKILFWTLRFLRKQHIMFTDRADWTVSIQIRRRLYCVQIRWEV